MFGHQRLLQDSTKTPVTFSECERDHFFAQDINLDRSDLLVSVSVFNDVLHAASFLMVPSSIVMPWAFVCSELAPAR